MKKICGFPDTFVVPEHVNYGDLFGNMATPLVIKEIFEVLLKICKTPSTRKRKLKKYLD